MVPLLLLAVPRALAAAPAGDLEKGRNAYQYGDYALVIRTLPPLLYPTVKLERPDDVVEAHRLLGLAYLFQKNETVAEREFVALLTLKPDYELDPLVDPPPFVEFFKRIKTRMREQLDAIRRKEEEARHARQAAEETRARELSDLRRKLVESQSKIYLVESQERSRLVALLPFGAGQFQNGHTKKGVFFLASELLLGTVSVALAVTVRLRWPEGVFVRDEREEADALVSAQVITGAAFLALALWGIVDANVHFVSRHQSPPRQVPRDTLRLGASPGTLHLGGSF